MKVGEVFLGMMLGVLLVAAGYHCFSIKRMTDKINSNHTELVDSISITDAALVELATISQGRLIELGDKVAYLLEEKGEDL